jgi:hypothetical protein
MHLPGAAKPTSGLEFSSTKENDGDGELQSALNFMGVVLN